MKNPRVQALLDQLGIKYPLILGGMIHLGNASLAAAFSEAGGLGQLGAGGFNPDELRKEIRKTRELTSRPFGVNVPLGRNVPAKKLLEVLAEEGVKMVSLGGGNPLPFIPPLKERGFTVMTVVGTPYHALRAQEAGTDIVIAEGFEAGGHDSPAELTLLTLVPRVVDTVSLPVVAAGGIIDGRGLVAALAMGASAVQIGTRFLATVESPAHPRYKEALVQGGDLDSIALGRRHGRLLRVLRTPLAEKLLAREKEGASWDELRAYVGDEANKAAALAGKLEKGTVFAGQGVGAIKEILPVARVIEKIMEEARKIIEDTLKGSIPR